MAIIKATHVLTWLPPGVADPAAIWELRENEEGGAAWSLGACAPADTDPAELAKWVSEDLGEPVRLGHRQEKRIKTGIFARTVVPFYYVFPGER